ncbi:MAG: ABC transporter permease [Candidatus Bipolaricaulis sp.]|nr:ABC transporter permease [Candidatus Bipolaricaulis sp.]
MWGYIVRRLLTGVLVLFGVVTIVFFSLQLAPGDPISMLIPAESGSGTSAEVVAALRAKYGLDKPVFIQYLVYLKNLVRLDLGQSISTDRPVAEALLSRYPATLELTICGLLVAVLIALPVGIVSAVRQNSVLDNISRVLALATTSIPSFWLGLLLMLLFSLQLRWLPASGRLGSVWSWDGLKHIIMPAVTLGAMATGILMRLVRSAMLEVLRADYLNTARAKGLRERTVIYRHALRNALIPVITVLGLQVGTLLGGTVVIETVFAWPGIGRYVIWGIMGKDFPVVQGGVLALTLGFVIVNILVDIAYCAVDPRVSYN